MRAGRHTAEHLFPPQPESCELTIVCPRSDYSASLIAKAVENADAHLLNLNVTSAKAPEGCVAVDLRISHRNAGSAARSLERYGMTVTAVYGGFDAEAELSRRRIDELLKHLQV